VRAAAVVSIVLGLVACRTRPLDAPAPDLAAVDLARADLPRPPDLGCQSGAPVEAAPTPGCPGCPPAFTCDGLEDCPCGEDCFGLACCLQQGAADCRFGCVESGGRPLCHRQQDCPSEMACLFEPGLPAATGVCSLACR